MAVRRIAVRLSREEKRRLRELAEMNHTSMTEMVRRMIDEEYYARWPEDRKPDGSPEPVTDRLPTEEEGTGG